MPGRLGLRYDRHLLELRHVGVVRPGAVYAIGRFVSTVLLCAGFPALTVSPHDDRADSAQHATD